MRWESLVPMTWRLTRHKWSRYSHRRRNIPKCPSPPTIIYLMMTWWRSLRSDGPTSWGSSHYRRHKPTNPATLSLSLSLSQPVTPAEVRNAIKISHLNRSTGPTGLMGKDTELAPPVPGPKPPRRHIPLEVFKYIYQVELTGDISWREGKLQTQ